MISNCECGGHPYFEYYPELFMVEIGCWECNNQVFANSEEEAIRKWNNREYEKWDDPAITGIGETESGIEPFKED